MHPTKSLAILLSSLLTVTEAQNLGATVNNPSNKPIKHGKQFTVNFVNNEGAANTYAYVAIYISRAEDPLDEFPDDALVHSYLYDCDTQEDCLYSPVDAPTSGSVKFSIKPLSDYSENDKYFPLNGGNYRACFANEVYNPNTDEVVQDNLIGSCDEFSVRAPKKKQIKRAKVTIPSVVAQNTPIKVKVKTPVRVVNQWVGIYNINDLTINDNKVTGPLPAEKLWGYTHCELNTGNVPGGSCGKKNGKKKTITLEKKNTEECETCEWPLQKGTYVACVNFNTNELFDKYKCSSQFQIA